MKPLPIWAITVNPALDITYELPCFSHGQTHRVQSIQIRPGGKGLNVARVLNQLNVPVIASGLLGGPRGRQIAALLQNLAPAVGQQWITTAVESRQSVAIVAGGEATVLNESGQNPPAESWIELAALLRREIQPGQVVALCGSFPGQAGADELNILLSAITDRGGVAIVDTSGPLLLDVARAGAALLKPNSGELCAALNLPDPLAQLHPEADTEQVNLALTQLASVGAKLLSFGAKAVAVSAGPWGLLGLTAGGAWWARPGAALAGNPTGAGDAAVAALSWALQQTSVAADTWLEAALPTAVALSAAAVLKPTAGEVDLAAYQKMLPTIPVRKIHAIS